MYRTLNPMRSDVYFIFMVFSFLSLIGLQGCSPQDPPPIPNPWESWVLLGKEWVEEDSEENVDSWPLSHQILEETLVNLQNRYSQLRLQKYTPQQWGALRLWNPQVSAIALEDALSLSQLSPSSIPFKDLPKVDDIPWQKEALLDLGKTLFFQYPIQLVPALQNWLKRRKPSIEEALRTQNWNLLDSFGIPLIADDNQKIILGGMVWANTPSGPLPSLTCASCHASFENQNWMIGQTNPHFDYGALLDFEIDLRTARSLWGPGRVDVTSDELDNPVYITDLRPLRFQKYLHRSATLEHQLLSLAIRIDTLIITSLNQAVRPPRKWAFALALYLWSLADDLPPFPNHLEGYFVFGQHCSACHQGVGLSGGGVPLEEIKTSPLVGQSSSRGTGMYRVPSLRGVGTRHALMSDGSFPDLETLLNPLRLQEQS